MDRRNRVGGKLKRSLNEGDGDGLGDRSVMHFRWAPGTEFFLKKWINLLCIIYRLQEYGTNLRLQRMILEPSHQREEMKWQHQCPQSFQNNRIRVRVVHKFGLTR